MADDFYLTLEIRGGCANVMSFLRIHEPQAIRISTSNFGRFFWVTIWKIPSAFVSFLTSKHTQRHILIYLYMHTMNKYEFLLGFVEQLQPLAQKTCKDDHWRAMRPDSETGQRSKQRHLFKGTYDIPWLCFDELCQVHIHGLMQRKRISTHLMHPSYLHHW